MSLSRALRRRKLGHRLTSECVLAFCRCVEQAKDGEQRGLATSRRPGDSDVFPRLYLEMDVLERVRFHLVREEDLLEAGEADERLVAVTGHSAGGERGTGLLGCGLGHWARG